ncbi:MAG: hypothetical protein AAF085_17990, partial [Planctomycetota bacterium]
VACVAMPPSIADADAEYPAVGASLGAMPAETGAAFARDDDEHKVDYSLREYHYDFGPLRGPIMEDWTPLTNKTKGDIYWTGETRQLRAVAVPKREGVNNANIDYVTSRSPITLNHKIANGTWRVVMNMGDARRGHDQMGVRAEGELISNNINSGRLEFPYVSTDGGSETPAHFEVEVTDGVLSIELFDNGGKDRYWVLTRLSLQRVK